MVPPDWASVWHESTLVANLNQTLIDLQRLDWMMAVKNWISSSYGKLDYRITIGNDTVAHLKYCPALEPVQSLLYQSSEQHLILSDSTADGCLKC